MCVFRTQLLLGAPSILHNVLEVSYKNCTAHCTRSSLYIKCLLHMSGGYIQLLLINMEDSGLHVSKPVRTRVDKAAWGKSNNGYCVNHVSMRKSPRRVRQTSLRDTCTLCHPDRPMKSGLKINPVWNVRHSYNLAS